MPFMALDLNVVLKFLIQKVLSLPSINQYQVFFLVFLAKVLEVFHPSNIQSIK